jgi:hypothetical protein
VEGSAEDDVKNHENNDHKARHQAIVGEAESAALADWFGPCCPDERLGLLLERLRENVSAGGDDGDAEHRLRLQFQPIFRHSLRQALQNDAQRLQEAGIAPWAAVTVKLG